MKKLTIAVMFCAMLFARQAKAQARFVVGASGDAVF